MFFRDGESGICNRGGEFQQAAFPTDDPAFVQQRRRQLQLLA